MHKHNGRKCQNPECGRWNTPRHTNCKHCNTPLVIKVIIEISESRKEKKPPRKNTGKGFGNDGRIRRK